MSIRSTVYWLAVLTIGLALILWGTMAYGSVNPPERPKVDSAEKFIPYSASFAQIVATREEVEDRLFIYGCSDMDLFTREVRGGNGLILVARCTRRWRK